jgi:hypothetical protein
MRTLFSSNCFVDPAFRKPGLRPNNAEMSPAAFVGLVAAWSAALIGMLLIAIVLRVVG